MKPHMVVAPPPCAAAGRCRAIAIGASAGGVEALGTLLPRLPADFARPVLVVLHLPPRHPSPLASMLDARCAVPVREALDKERIRPGTVYLAPPDYHLLVETDGTLALSVDPPVLYSRPAIDPLFESASAAYGEALLAIVLTGASADGAAGLAAVRRAGGTAWVQRPDSAAHPTMPQAALQMAGADAVYTLEEMGRQLALLSGTSHHPHPPTGEPRDERHGT
ncbi:two-component system chemotaxis response regulator CheB [Caldimonas thermodepolymerans]|jgi:Chemotaxis response regulator containing a CheY-like receiver domain and a methylesterase domain|nr:two-component system chemotaxis response regulator CheB [Caldimonas thermodepolymerans]